MRSSPPKFGFVPRPWSRRLAALSALLLACVCCAIYTGAQQDDDEVLNVESNLVVLNVTATDKSGGYIHGLKRDDFRIYEDGARQTITTFGEEDTPFAAAILIDTSGSMEGRVMLARAAAIRFLDSLRPQDVAAVYRFDSKIEQLQDFSPSRDLASVAYSANARGMTVLHDAVRRAAQDLAARDEKRKAILVLSDGADTQSRTTQSKALAAALAANVTIYAVDMSSDASGSRTIPNPALRAYAEKSGGRYVATPGGREMREAFTAIAEELSNQYTIGYLTQNRTHDGAWREIKIDGPRQDVRLRTRTGYRAPKKR